MNLTKRESEIIKRSAMGATADEIAAEFGRSVETVRTQIKLAREKLGARNMAHMVAIAITQNLVKLMCLCLCLSMLSGIDDARRTPRTGRMARRQQVVAIYA